MTRDQIKERILKEIRRGDEPDKYGFMITKQQVAENIMELWDQGFAYEISSGCDCSEYCDCKS